MQLKTDKFPYLDTLTQLETSKMKEIIKTVKEAPLWTKLLGAGLIVYFAAYLIKEAQTANIPGGAIDRDSAPIVKNTSPNSPKLAKAFREVASQYGDSFAQTLEKMFRWESGHFKSGQWSRCGSPGMVATKGSAAFPWGWASLAEYCSNKNISPNGFYTVYFPQTSAGPLSYIAFPDAAISVKYTAWFIQTKRGGNVSAWGSLLASDQSQYNQYLAGVSARFV